MQARYPAEAAVQIEREKSARMAQLLNSPLLKALIGGGNTGFTTNFGQGIGGGQPNKESPEAIAYRQNSSDAASGNRAAQRMLSGRGRPV
jgi:hypothetical protein